MPYWRLSAYYLTYFASLGALVPFWALYLQERGFDALAIGQLMAILSGTKILAPMVWGHIVDHWGHRMLMVRIGALFAAVGFLGVFGADDGWSMALVMLVFSFFWNASLPQLEAVTFNHLRVRPERYALVRVWGSVGFILVVIALGEVLQHRPLGLVPYWVVLLLFATLLSTLFIPDREPAQVTATAVSLRQLLRRPAVLAFFTACFLTQLSHGIYYAFYSIHLEAAGYSSAAVGWLWALGVMAEVLIFLAMHRLLERFNAWHLLLWSLALAALRWLWIGAFIDILALQLAAQLLHAASFGVFHAAAIHVVHHAFPGRTQGRGQALYTSVSFGAGGAAGSLLGGVLWEPAGPLLTFGVGTLAALLGLLIAWRGLSAWRLQEASWRPRPSGCD